MRLEPGGAYIADINSLRDQIRANGTRPNIQMITISHPASPNPANLYMNLAFEPNSNLPRINGSLYAVAFGNANGIWNFNVGAIGVALPGGPFPGNLDGSYASLGYAARPLPTITNANLEAAVAAVAGYGGAAPVPGDVLDGMARLIIAVNEAVRLGAITSGVNGVLGNNGNSYIPDTNAIRNWGGHTLGS